jgi:TIR domain-containing protein
MANDARGMFISYRREESAGYTGRIADRFTEHFGKDRVFRDIDSIEPGLDFAEAIERAIGSSGVMLAVIGKNWLTATDAAGRKRLQDPHDYVRMEISAALQRNMRVIPVLVQGASMPGTDELPEDLAPLTRRNAFELHDSSWGDDVGRLISALERVLDHRRAKAYSSVPDETKLRVTQEVEPARPAGNRFDRDRAGNWGIRILKVVLVLAALWIMFYLIVQLLMYVLGVR